MAKHTHTYMNYSLKTVKQGYYAFYLKQRLGLHHEGNLLLACLNKRNYLPVHINICSVFGQYVIQEETEAYYPSFSCEGIYAFSFFILMTVSLTALSINTHEANKIVAVRAKIVLLYVNCSIQRLWNCSELVNVSRTLADNTATLLPKDSSPLPLCQAQWLVWKQVHSLLFKMDSKK